MLALRNVFDDAMSLQLDSYLNCLFANFGLLVLAGGRVVMCRANSDFGNRGNAPKKGTGSNDRIHP